MPAARRRTRASDAQPTSEEVDAPDAGNGDRFLTGWFAKASDFIFRASEVPVFLGSLSSAALLGYNIALRAESLKEVTDLQLLLYRSSYTPAAVYDLLEQLGPEGRAEYQYVNFMSFGLFPLLIATFFATSIGRTFDRAGLGHDWNLFPAVFAFAASLETGIASWLVLRFPEVHVNLAAIAGLLASLKFRFLTYTVMMMLVGIAWVAKNVVRDAFNRNRSRR